MIAHRMTLAAAAALVAAPAFAHPGHGPAEFPAGIVHQIVSLAHLPTAALWAALAASGVALGLILRRRTRPRLAPEPSAARARVTD